MAGFCADEDEHLIPHRQEIVSLCKDQMYTSCGVRTVGPSFVSCCDGRCTACTCTSGVDPAVMGATVFALRR